MAWWSSISNASKLATSALKQAQKKLDRVLDIDDDIPQDNEQCEPFFFELIDFLFNAFNYCFDFHSP